MYLCVNENNFKINGKFILLNLKNRALLSPVND